MYSKKELMTLARKLIPEKKLIYFNELASVLGISRPTLYKYFPPESKAYIELETLLIANRVNDKILLRDKLLNSSSPSAWEKLYRLLATPDEHKLLSSQPITETDSEDRKVIIEFANIDDI